MEPETDQYVVPIYSHPMAGHVGFLLRRVQLAIFNDFQQRTTEFNISPTEYSILTVVSGQRNLQQNQLAKIVGVKPANCVALITALEKRRLLDRKEVGAKPARGRAKALRLTPAGERLLKQMNRRVGEHQRFLVQLLGYEAHEDLRMLLLTLLQYVERGLFG